MKGKGGKRIMEQTGETKVKEVSNVPSLFADKNWERRRVQFSVKGNAVKRRPNPHD